MKPKRRLNTWDTKVHKLELEYAVLKASKDLVLWWNEPETDLNWSAWDDEHLKRRNAFELAVWELARIEQ
jgi:hypothetical protein